MPRPIARPGRRREGAILVAAESLALSVLVLVAVHVLRETDVVQVRAWQAALALGAGLAAYWTLQALRGDRIAFWLLAPAVALPHIAPAWSHNRIGWHELLDVREALADDRSVSWDLALFVACLAVLLALHRIIGIRRLNRRMLRQGVDARERRLVMRHEGLLVIGLIATGLLATGPMIVVAGVLASSEGLPVGSSPAIAAIGGGAAVLLASTLWLWFRGLRGSSREGTGVRTSSGFDQSEC